MKIVFNIKKNHLVYFCIFLLLFSVVLVFGQNAQQSHSIGEILIDTLNLDGKTVTAIGANIHVNSSGLIVIDKLHANEIVGGCKEGYARLNAQDFGTCIAIDPIAEAGCVGDECSPRGMRSCTCMEVGQAYVNGVINPTDNSINPAGEYCLTDVGHCQGVGNTCLTGEISQYVKIWPHLEIQRPLWTYGGILRPNSPHFMQRRSSPLCDQTLPSNRVSCTNSGGGQSTHVPGHNCGYPYGSVRCCY
tara:strand:+ start:440 stop:1177 length:738 start_codon:yes stop_codon:yes gene_type:complete